MAESIKRDERIRLKDGRLMTLDAAKLGEGKYEVMLLDLKTGEDLDTVMVPTEAEALEEFERLRERWHHPEAMPAELKGKYRKLAEDLKSTHDATNRKGFTFTATLKQITLGSSSASGTAEMMSDQDSAAAASSGGQTSPQTAKTRADGLKTTTSEKISRLAAMNKRPVSYLQTDPRWAKKP